MRVPSLQRFTAILGSYLPIPIHYANNGQLTYKITHIQVQAIQEQVISHSSYCPIEVSKTLDRQQKLPPQEPKTSGGREPPTVSYGSTMSGCPEPDCHCLDYNAVWIPPSFNWSSLIDIVFQYSIIFRFCTFHVLSSLLPVQCFHSFVRLYVLYISPSCHFVVPLFVIELNEV